MTVLGETEHFSGKNGALRWSILLGPGSTLGVCQAAFFFVGDGLMCYIEREED